MTRFDKVEFTERLRLMSFTSEQYGGTLTDAIGATEHIDPSDTPPAEPSFDMLSDDQHRQYTILAQRLKNAGVLSAVIEAAHVYMYQDLSDESLQSSLKAQSYHGGLLGRRLEAGGISVRNMLFVDDYNPDPKGDKDKDEPLDIEELLTLTRSAGYDPTILLKESDMVELGKGMLRFMGEQQELLRLDPPRPKVVEGKDPEPQTVKLVQGGIELYRGSDEMVSCAMLDTALSVVKFHALGEAVINILPRSSPDGGFSYKGQQKKMRTIIHEHLNVRYSPLVNLYTGNTHADPVAAGAHHAFRKRH